MTHRASACATSSRQSRAACVWACSIASLGCSKKGLAWISRGSHGGEAGVGAGGGNGSLCRLRGGATWRCRAMGCRTHVRSAAVAICVNCYRSSSTVGAVPVKRGFDSGGIDRTPLTWFQMLRAVGLATFGGAPFTGGTMCVGRLLVMKGGACCNLSKTHACEVGTLGSAMWQLPPFSAPVLEGRIAEGKAGAASGWTCAVLRWTLFTAT